jgi:FMN phosphatase YigB (HAD superfamily)
MAWISFDLDGTICDYPMFHAVFKAMRANWPEPALKALGTLFKQRLGSNEPTMAFDWDEMNAVITDDHDLEPLPDILEFAAKQDFDQRLVYTDTQPALKALRGNGWRIACGTNGYAKYQAYALERLNIQVEAFIAPDTVGFAKPQAQFLRSLPAITKQNDALAGLIHVGDLLTQDVLAANRAGVKSAWIWRDMPEEFRSIAPAQRANNPLLGERIVEQSRFEFEEHGRMNLEANDLAPKPDYVVADLLELIPLLGTTS